ncbi:MAG: 30S ribosomal protein S6 [Deltaproteobacteria bacterium]|nr:30S ribosomal protein S6 [Deltaproteobacteria bacterium]
MNLYELMFILDPDLEQDIQEKLIQRLQSTITKNSGRVIRVVDMGVTNFAYKIQKKAKGHYFLNYLEGPGSMIYEIERFLRIDENVLRFVLFKMGKHVTVEDLEEKPEESPGEKSEQSTEEPIKVSSEEEGVEQDAE